MRPLLLLLRSTLLVALGLLILWPAALRAQQLSPQDREAKGLEALEAPSVLAAAPATRAVAPGTYTLRGGGADNVLFVPESTDDRVLLLDAATGDVLDAAFIADTETDDNLATPIQAMLNFDGDGVFVSDQINDAILEYDLEGNFVGIFAPAGGVDNAILDNVRGFAMSPDGTELWVTTAGGANAGAIAAFDTDGAYLGNFIEPGTGGIASPFDIYVRDADVLVSDTDGSPDRILRYNLDGTFIEVWNSGAEINFPQQIAEAGEEGEGDVLVGAFSTPSGVFEYASDGTFEATYDVITGNRGVYELPNGNILTTNGSGIHEITRDNTLVRTIAEGSARFITRGDLGPGGDDSASVLFDDQDSGGLSVVVASVSVPADGYVAIHDSTLLDGNVAGSVIGVSDFLTAGSYSDLVVELFDVPGAGFPADTALTDDQTLIAMPHQETGGNTEYDFITSGGAEDGPFFVGNDPMQGAVTDAAFVTIVEVAGGLTFDPDPLVTTLAAGETGTETVTVTNTADVPVAFDFSQYSSDDPPPAGTVAPAHGEFAGRALDLAKGQDDPRRGSGQAFGEGGPDAFGYRWIDSNEPGGPTFDFVDISGTGTALALGDDQGVSVPLPFTFSFYGNEFDAVTVGSNGYLTFTGAGGSFSNAPIPTATGDNNIVAPFWDDLDPGDGNGTVYTQDMGDGRFVVMYDGVPDFPGPGPGTENTFEVVLYENGQILFQYAEILGDPIGNTVGIENADGADGLEIAFNEAYVEAGLAVLIARRPQFVTDVSPATGTIPAGGSAEVEVAFSAEGLVGGTYNGALVVETDLGADPSTFELEVQLIVEGMAACAITASEVVFEPTIVGTSSTEEATVTNGGTDACELSAASADGAFSVEGFSAVTLSPGESASFDVVFSPTAPGDAEGTLTVEQAGGDALTAALSGSGLAEPTPSVDPASLTVNVLVGEQASESFTLSNEGGADAADLAFDISIAANRPSLVVNPGSEARENLRNGAREAFVTGVRTIGAARGQSGSARLVPDVLPQGPFEQTAEPNRGGGDIVQDGSFEDGTPNSFWTEFSAAFGTPLCDVASCGVGGGTGPFDGNWWTWFGGTAAGDEGSVEQDVVIPSGAAMLSFFLEIPVAVDAPGSMSVLIDGEEVFAVTEADQATYATYQEVMVDVSDYADGGTHTLRFESTTSANGNFFVDLVSITSTGPAFVSVSPNSGIIAPGDDQEITVNVDATDVEPGTYEFDLVIATNDPSNPIVTVNLTVNVTTVANEDDAVPTVFALHAAYPNPFAAATTVGYDLPEATHVTIEVYDAVGRHVATLVDAEQAAGRYEAEWDARALASGVYLYRIQAGSYAETMKVSLVR